MKNKSFFLQSRCRLSDVPIIICSALCQQGSAVTPTSITGRMVMILSFISFMFLFVSYCANIVALLQSPSNQIRTLRDLYDTKMEFSILDTAYNRHYFAVSEHNISEPMCTIIIALQYSDGIRTVPEEILRRENVWKRWTAQVYCVGRWHQES